MDTLPADKDDPNHEGDVFDISCDAWDLKVYPARKSGTFVNYPENDSGDSGGTKAI